MRASRKRRSTRRAKKERGSPTSAGSGSRLSPLGREVLAVAVILAAWGLFCWEIFANFSTQVYLMGSMADAVGQLWMTWWIDLALGDPDLSLFHSHLFNAPAGAEVISHDLAWVHLLLAGSLTSTLGLNRAINLIFVLGLLGGGLASHALFRTVTSSRALSAALAIVGMCFIPRFMGGYVDIDMADYGPMALCLALWLRGLKRGSRASLVGAALVLAVASMVQMYNSINLFLFFGVTLILLWRGIAPFPPTLDRPLLRTGVMVAVAASLLLPFAIFSMLSLSEIPTPASLPLVIQRAAGYNPSLPTNLALLLLPPLMLVTWRLGSGATGIRFWGVQASLFALLASGFYLLVPGSRLMLPLPALLLKNYAPFFWRYNFTDRFGRLGILLLGLLACACFEVLRERPAFKRSGQYRALLLAGVALLVFFTAPLMVMLRPQVAAVRPVPVMSYDDYPKFLDRIAKEPGRFNVLDLSCREHNTFAALRQIAHSKPIIGVPLRPPEHIPPEDLTPLSHFITRFCALATAKGEAPRRLPERDLLRKQGVRYLMLDWGNLGRLGKGFLHRWERAYGEPVEQSHGIRLYRVRGSPTKNRVSPDRQAHPQSGLIRRFEGNTASKVGVSP